MWRAASNYDGTSPLDYWLKFKATGRMKDVLRKSNLELAAETEEIEWQSTRVFHDLDIAYHLGSVAQAVSSLTTQQQAYIRLRFWGDASYAELSQTFGYEPSGIWRQAKKNLQRELAHLREYM